MEGFGERREIIDGQEELNNCKRTKKRKIRLWGQENGDVLERRRRTGLGWGIKNNRMENIGEMRKN